MRTGRASALTDTGRRRPHNEDTFVCEPPLFAVADGPSAVALGSRTLAGGAASSIGAPSVPSASCPSAPYGSFAGLPAVSRRCSAHRSPECTLQNIIGRPSSACLSLANPLARAHSGWNEA